MVDEVIGGDRLDPSNVFRWDYVRLNLPGSETYDPSLPWVSKVRRSDGKIAADRTIFVDDVRPVGNTKQECQQATRKVGSKFSYHGIQDASRKRRKVSQTPGAWAGSVVWTSDNEVNILVSEDKWTKTKGIVKELEEMVETRPEAMPRKRLEEIRGFLNYVAQTYRGLSTYMNGLHLTIDGWRDNRDAGGWKQRRFMAPPDDDLVKDAGDADSAIAPATVEAKPRLKRDIQVLRRLTRSEKPPLRPVRRSKVYLVVYGFGDASGPGFGFSSQEAGNKKIDFEYGQWPCSATEEESSNWRELNNIVVSIEGLGEAGKLVGAEVFIATDNSTTESAHHKGYSSSPRLDELIVRLYELELTYQFTLFLFHVSGRRMIAQGTDGLSRGDKGTGSMQGVPLWKYLPLNESAFQRSPRLEEWCRYVCGGLGEPTVLTPEGWFSDAHSEGIFIWAPPPAAANVVMEQLSLAKHKRPTAFHMVVVPRLLTGMWRKHMGRATDLYFRLSHGPLWDLTEQHEPVLVFISLPVISHLPRFQERRKLLEALESLVLGTGVQEADSPKFRDSLRKLLGSSRDLLRL